MRTICTKLKLLDLLKPLALMVVFLFFGYNAQSQSSNSPVCKNFTPIYLTCAGGVFITHCDDGSYPPTYPRYSWICTATGYTSTERNPTILVGDPYYKAGTYYLTLYYGPGLSENGFTTVVFVDTLTPGVASADQTICPGGTPANLTSTTFGNVISGYVTYTWQKSVSPFTTWTNTAITGVGGWPLYLVPPYTFPDAPILVTTKYRVKADNDYCLGYAPVYSNVVTITVQALPEAGTISGPTPVCQGTTNTYSISSVTGATSYTWTLPSGWSGSSATTSIDATAGSSGGNITVTANNSCGPGPAQSKSVSVVIVPAQVSVTNITVLNGQNNCYTATQTITVAGSNTTFIVQNGGSVTMIAGQTINYLPGTSVESGGYMHGYIATGVCCGVGGLAPSIIANQSEPDSLEKLSIPSFASTFFKVYPNPTTGNFILELNGDCASSIANVEVFGMQGEKILTTVLNGERKRELSLSDRPAGIYFIRVISGSKAASAKIIKQ